MWGTIRGIGSYRTHPCQFPPLLPWFPPRGPNNSCCSTTNNIWRISLSHKTSPLRNEMLILSCIGLASSHSIFYDLGQLGGCGIGGCTQSILACRTTSFAKLSFTGHISVLDKQDHGLDSNKNKGTLLASDKHNPRDDIGGIAPGLFLISRMNINLVQSTQEKVCPVGTNIVCHFVVFLLNIIISRTHRRVVLNCMHQLTLVRL